MGLGHENLKQSSGASAPPSSPRAVLQLVLNVQQEGDAEESEAQELALRTAYYERDLLSHQLEAVTKQRGELQAELRAAAAVQQQLVTSLAAAQAETAALRQQAAGAAAELANAQAAAAAAQRQQRHVEHLLRKVLQGTTHNTDGQESSGSNVGMQASAESGISADHKLTVAAVARPGRSAIAQAGSSRSDDSLTGSLGASNNMQNGDLSDLMLGLFDADDTASSPLSPHTSDVLPAPEPVPQLQRRRGAQDSSQLPLLLPPVHGVDARDHVLHADAGTGQQRSGASSCLGAVGTEPIADSTKPRAAGQAGMPPSPSAPRSPRPASAGSPGREAASMAAAQPPPEPPIPGLVSKVPIYGTQPPPALPAQLRPQLLQISTCSLLHGPSGCRLTHPGSPTYKPPPRSGPSPTLSPRVSTALPPQAPVMGTALPSQAHFMGVALSSQAPVMGTALPSQAHFMGVALPSQAPVMGRPLSPQSSTSSTPSSPPLPASRTLTLSDRSTTETRHMPSVAHLPAPLTAAAARIPGAMHKALSDTRLTAHQGASRTSEQPSALYHKLEPPVASHGTLSAGGALVADMVFSPPLNLAHLPPGPALVRPIGPKAAAAMRSAGLSPPGQTQPATVSVPPAPPIVYPAPTRPAPCPVAATAAAAPAARYGLAHAASLQAPLPQEVLTEEASTSTQLTAVIPTRRAATVLHPASTAWATVPGMPRKPLRGSTQSLTALEPLDELHQATSPTRHSTLGTYPAWHQPYLQPGRPAVASRATTGTAAGLPGHHAHSPGVPLRTACLVSDAFGARSGSGAHSGSATPRSGGFSPSSPSGGGLLYHPQLSHHMSLQAPGALTAGDALATALATTRPGILGHSARLAENMMLLEALEEITHHRRAEIDQSLDHVEHADNDSEQGGGGHGSMVALHEQHEVDDWDDEGNVRLSSTAAAVQRPECPSATQDMEQSTGNVQQSSIRGVGIDATLSGVHAKPGKLQAAGSSNTASISSPSMPIAATGVTTGESGSVAPVANAATVVGASESSMTTDAADGTAADAARGFATDAARGMTTDAADAARGLATDAAHGIATDAADGMITEAAGGMIADAAVGMTTPPPTHGPAAPVAPRKPTGWQVADITALNATPTVDHSVRTPQPLASAPHTMLAAPRKAERVQEEEMAALNVTPTVSHHAAGQPLRSVGLSTAGADILPPVAAAGEQAAVGQQQQQQQQEAGTPLTFEHAAILPGTTPMYAQEAQCNKGRAVTATAASQQAECCELLHDILATPTDAADKQVALDLARTQACLDSYLDTAASAAELQPAGVSDAKVQGKAGVCEEPTPMQHAASRQVDSKDGKVPVTRSSAADFLTPAVGVTMPGSGAPQKLPAVQHQLLSDAATPTISYTSTGVAPLRHSKSHSHTHSFSFLPAGQQHCDESDTGRALTGSLDRTFTWCASSRTSLTSHIPETVLSPTSNQTVALAPYNAVAQLAAELHCAIQTPAMELGSSIAQAAVLQAPDSSTAQAAAASTPGGYSMSGDSARAVACKVSGSSSTPETGDSAWTTPYPTYHARSDGGMVGDRGLAVSGHTAERRHLVFASPLDRTTAGLPSDSAELLASSLHAAADLQGSAGRETAQQQSPSKSAADLQDRETAQQQSQAEGVTPPLQSQAEGAASQTGITAGTKAMAAIQALLMSMQQQMKDMQGQLQVSAASTEGVKRVQLQICQRLEQLEQQGGR